MTDCFENVKKMKRNQYNNHNIKHSKLKPTIMIEIKYNHLISGNQYVIQKKDYTTYDVDPHIDVVGIFISNTYRHCSPNPFPKFGSFKFIHYDVSTRYVEEFYDSYEFLFYEFPLQYLQDIRDYEYKPKIIPTLKTLSKLQLVTEEIRISRMYDGLF
jgi:hypothetical protein